MSFRTQFHSGSPPMGNRSHTSFFRVILATICFGIALLAVHATTARAQSTDFNYDSTFGSPYGYHWSRGGSFGNTYGQLVATTQTGDIVVASLVPPCSQGDQANGLFNLGLMLFDANGQPKAWPTYPGAYGCGAQEGQSVLTYPNTSTATIQFIRDIKIVNDVIYILYDRQYTASDEDVWMAIFGTDGHFIQNQSVAGSTSNEYGVSLVPYSIGSPTTYHLTTVVNVYGSQVGFIRLSNFGIHSNGTVTLNTTYGTSGYFDITAPTYCNQPPCQLTASRAVGEDPGIVSFVAGPDIYIVGDFTHTHTTSVNDTNAMVMDVTASGTIRTSFAASARAPGFLEIPFNVEGQYEDHSHDIVEQTTCHFTICTDTIWILDQPNTRCGTGIGIARLDGNGNLASGFGSGGSVVFGGQIGQPICILGSGDHPISLALSGNHLAVVGGYNFTSGFPVISFHYDPGLSIVDANTGTVDQYGNEPFINSGGRWGDGALTGVTPGPNGTFLAAGQAHDDSVNFWNLALARFADDTIFANGFE